MRVTIHQPEHLPWSGFFAKAAQADLLVLLDNVPFRKNYFQNRNRILTSRGVEWLTVPVLSKGHTNRTLQEMRINNTDVRWRARCWGKIAHAYGRHPHFGSYGPFIEDMYAREWELLTALNEHAIRQLCTWLRLEVTIQRASDLQLGGSGSELLVEICEATGAAQYIAGPSARDYLDEGMFRARRIGIRHAWYEPQPYAQLGTETFVEALSVVDMFFNCGDRSREVVLAGARSR